MKRRLLLLTISLGCCLVSLLADSDLPAALTERALLAIQNQTDQPLVALYLLTRGHEYASGNLLSTVIPPHAVAFIFAPQGDFLVRAVYRDQEFKEFYLEKPASFRAGKAYWMMIDKRVESAFLMPGLLRPSGEEEGDAYTSDEEYYDEGNEWDDEYYDDDYYSEDEEYYEEDYYE